MVHDEDRFGDVTSGRFTTAIGMIARNPFFRAKHLPPEFNEEAKASVLHEVTETELLLCSLRHWHGAGDIIDHYSLEGFEVTLGGTGYIVRPFCDWGRIVRRRATLARLTSQGTSRH